VWFATGVAAGTGFGGLAAGWFGLLPAGVFYSYKTYFLFFV
jgi:hypothetical protein